MFHSHARRSPTCLSPAAVIFALLAGLAIGGCAKSGPDGAPSATINTVPAAELTPPSDDECLAFAKRLEDFVEAGDIAGFNSAISWDTLIDRSIGDLKVSAEFRRGLLRGVTSNDSLAGTVCAGVKTNGTFRFLRILDKDQSKQAMFRLMGEDGFNYLGMILFKTPAGEVKAADVDSFLTGELMSKTLRRTMLPAVAAENRGLIERISGTESAYVKNLPKVSEMLRLAKSGHPDQALKIYRELPAELRSDKTVLVMRAQFSQKLSEAEYMEALEDCRKEFPHDPSINLLSIDYFVMTKRYAETRKAIDRLSKAVGGDPQLDMMSARISRMEKNYTEANLSAERAIAGDPALADAYWERITNALEQEDHAGTLHWLHEVESKCQVDIADLTTSPGYEKFIASPEFQQWLTSHDKPAQSEPASGEPGKQNDPQAESDE